MAIGSLVTCVDEGIEGQRIIIGRGAFLLNQRAENPDFNFGQDDVHTEDDNPNRRTASNAPILEGRLLPSFEIRVSSFRRVSYRNSEKVR